MAQEYHTIPSQYAALPGDVAPGNRILLNDGAVELRVVAVRGQDVECVVVAGGPVGDHKGINLPGRAPPIALHRHHRAR